MEWIKFIVSKLFGSSERSKEFSIITKEWRTLYEEKKSVVQEYEEQKKVIESYRHKHPGNGEELDEWHKREEYLMLQLVKEKEEKHFWKERAIFLEKENELLLIKKERSNFKQ